MEENQVEKLAIDLAEVHGVTADEAKSAINNVFNAFKNITVAVAEAFGVVVSAVTEVWELIEECIRNRKENETASGWDIDWDTRKKSLVISNRPRYMVRKIIR